MENRRLWKRWATAQMSHALTLAGIVENGFALFVYAMGVSLGIVFGVLVGTSNPLDGAQGWWTFLSVLGGLGISSLWFVSWKVFILPRLLQDDLQSDSFPPPSPHRQRTQHDPPQ